MQGHVRKRGKTYTAVVFEGVDPGTGKKRYRWYGGFKTRREAETKLSKTVTALHEGEYVTPSKLSVAEFLERWLTYVETQVSPTSFDSYAFAIRAHVIPALGKMQLHKLQSQHILDYYAKKGRSGRLDGKPGGLGKHTLHNHHVLMQGAFKCAVQWGLLGKNFMDEIDPPKFTVPEMNVMDVEEIKTLLEAAKATTQWYPQFHVALYSGLRRSELLALRWRDVDLVTGQATVARSLHRLQSGQYIIKDTKKKKSKREVILPQETVEVLKAHQETEVLRGHGGKDDLIFARPDGRPPQPQSMTLAWIRLRDKLGLKVRLHDARHTHATLMLANGVHPKIVQERLGHSTIATTLDIYSHVVPGLQEEAAKTFGALFHEEARISKD